MTPCVLVTGGSGFIGTWVLRELLNRNVPVVSLDTHRAPERWRRLLASRADEVIETNASLLDRDQLQTAIEQHGVTHIIHLAALLTPACQQDPWLGCEVNVLGTTAIFDAARRSGLVHSISYASSYAVYGPEVVSNPQNFITDQSPNRPPSFYGAFKQAADLIAEQYWRHFGIASIAIRPHVVYGPERDQGLTAGPSLACRAVARGDKYSIGYRGRVGYDYVEDVAGAFVRAVFECPRGATIVDLPGEQASTEQFASTIESVFPAAAGLIQISGPEIPANIPPNPHYITRTFPDWRTTSLAVGIRRTIEFYQV